MTGLDRETIVREIATTGCISPVISGMQKLFGNLVTEFKRTQRSLGNKLVKAFAAVRVPTLATRAVPACA